MKEWVERAVKLLEKSIYPVPHELNELDWKCDLSTNVGRLAMHISAMACIVVDFILNAPPKPNHM